jgi:hypothetical protein
MNLEIYKNICRFFPTKEKRMRFIALSCLTFGIRVETLEELLGIDKNILYRELVDRNDFCSYSLEKLFWYGSKNQELAKASFLDFYERLLNSCKNRNDEEIKIILKEIGNHDAICIQKRKPNSRISDNDVRILIVYQLKYFLTSQQMGQIFNMDKNRYRKKVLAYFEQHPEEKELLIEYDHLHDYNCSKYIMRKRVQK